MSLSSDDPIWHPTTFTKNRDRLLHHQVMGRFLEKLMAAPMVQGLLSGEHVSVDGTLLQAWASHASLERIDREHDPPPPPSGPGEGLAAPKPGKKRAKGDFRGIKLSNKTHRSSVDPDSLLARKSNAHPAQPSYLGHVLAVFCKLLDHVKGVEVLLEALALALKADVELHLDLIGAGTPSSQHRLRGLSKQLLLQPHVRWLGPQPRTSLAKHYRRCHLVVVPSLDDPLLTVTLEALACGRPVLGSDLEGIKFLVGNAESCVLVPPGQPVALAQAIIRLKDDRNEIASLAQSAQQQSSKMSWTTNVNALQEMIRNFGVPEL